MQSVTMSRIEAELRLLPPEKLTVVLDFVSYLAARRPETESFQTMLASEHMLCEEWERPEEDEAWADL